MSEPDSEPEPLFPKTPNVVFRGLKSPEASKVVFFGNSLGVECQRCGAYNQTLMGHKFCQHITCPIAIREVKRRRRKRTSTLEQVYIPRKRAQVTAEAEAQTDKK